MVIFIFGEIFRVLTTNKDVKWAEWHNLISLTSIAHIKTEGYVCVFTSQHALSSYPIIAWNFLLLGWPRHSLNIPHPFLPDKQNYNIAMTGFLKGYICQNTKILLHTIPYLFCLFLWGKGRKKVSVSICCPSSDMVTDNHSKFWWLISFPCAHCRDSSLIMKH